MQEFHGNLLIGGLAIKNLDGVLDRQAEADHESWSGQFEVEPFQKDVLEIGRQYLLMLDDGQNHEVVITEIVPGEEGGHVMCQFVDSCSPGQPR